jgi:hypothetical protein
MKYVHYPLNEEVEFLCGSYWIEREERLPYQGGEVLYLVGRTSDITSCCGSCSPFSFIKVVGKVKKWKYGADERGYAISEIEPIGDEEEQRVLKGILSQHNRDVRQIEFW